MRTLAAVTAAVLILSACSTHEHGGSVDKSSHKITHGGHHRFINADKWAKKFDALERDGWQHPAKVIAAMAVSPGMKVAEIGASTGYFTVRLARAIPKARVYGVDIEPTMIAYLTRRAEKEGLPNLLPVLGKADGPALPEQVDRVLMVNTAHHIPERGAYFRKVQAALRPGGKIFIVEFKMGDIPVGPPEAMRISASTLDAELTGAGLKRQALDTTTLPHQYITVYK